MASAAESLAVRVLAPDETDAFAALARLETDAYPVLRADSAESLARFAERIRTLAGEPGTRVAVVEDGTELVAAMVLYDFTMRVREADGLAGGLASVAVALTRKRRGLARMMVRWYLDDYRARGAAFAVLHPFKTDFYRALGFGYGTPTQRYRFAPAAIEPGEAQGAVRFLGPADREALMACDERVRATTNGLIARTAGRAERALSDPALRYVGVEDAGVLRGFMQTNVRLGADGTANANELVVRDLYAESPAYEAALLAYLRAQRDQFARIALESQDGAMWLVASDPRDGSDLLVTPPGTHRVAETGLGVMYRILDVERAFAHLAAADAPLVVRFEVGDAFFAPTAGSWSFRFGPHGAPSRDDAAAPDAIVRAGIAELSSLVVGSLRLRDAVRRGRAEVEPQHLLDRVARALDAPQPPICTTRF